MARASPLVIVLGIRMSVTTGKLGILTRIVIHLGPTAHVRHLRGTVRVVAWRTEMRGRVAVLACSLLLASETTHRCRLRISFLCVQFTGISRR